MNRRFALNLFLALACLLVAWIPARAASVLPLYLDEVVDTAAVAFEGTCVGNRSERDPATNVVVTYTTFEVREVLKGSVGAKHVIKQIGGALTEDGVEYRVEGIPRFAEGESYVVFLAGKSAAGFSSPIGLGQGRFRVEGAPAARTVTNGRDFRDLTARMLAHVPPLARDRIEKAQAPVREIGLEDFKRLVRGHAGEKR